MEGRGRALDTLGLELVGIHWKWGRGGTLDSLGLELPGWLEGGRREGRGRRTGSGMQGRREEEGGRRKEAGQGRRREIKSQTEECGKITMEVANRPNTRKTYS